MTTLDITPKPKGLSFFGWSIITISILNLAGLLFSTFYRKDPPSFLYHYYVTLFVMWPVIALYLLRLRNWARVAMLVISCCVLVQIVVSVPYAKSTIEARTDQLLEGPLVANIMNSAKESYRDGEYVLTDKELDRVVKITLATARKTSVRTLSLFTILGALIASLFNLSLILYFTRQGVRKRFT